MTVGTALRFVGCQHSVKVNNGGEIEPRAIAETLKARRWRLMTDVRPSVARYLGAGRLRSRTLEMQGVALPSEALEAVAGVPYAAGVAPYLPLLPLITDRHVDVLTLAGTIEEVIEHIVALSRAGIDGIIIRPFAPEGGTIEETIVTFGSGVWPRVMAAVG